MGSGDKDLSRVPGEGGVALSTQLSILILCTLTPGAPPGLLPWMDPLLSFCPSRAAIRLSVNLSVDTCSV